MYETKAIQDAISGTDANGGDHTASAINIEHSS
jgi:hypothetical protein